MEVCDVICEMKMNLPHLIQYQNVPTQFLYFYLYVRNLQFEEEPNY